MTAKSKATITENYRRKTENKVKEASRTARDQTMGENATTKATVQEREPGFSTDSRGRQ